MNEEQIICAIEAIQWDYEEALVPESIHYIQKDDLVMIKNDKSASVYANKVVRFSQTLNEVEEAIAYFQDSPFSWWIQTSSESSELEKQLIKLGMKHADTYVGLAKEVTEEIPSSSEYIHKEVTTKEDVLGHVEIAGKVWGYDNQAMKAAINERASYLQFAERRGGYTLLLDGKYPIGYSNYRYSKDGKALYLNGAAVLPEYRGKGIYKNMLKARLYKASQRGCEIAVTQARVGTSEPILRKLGFREYAEYKQYIRE
ncbi:GNAT family N-acetyltransferase [Alkalihalobacillus hwajinpoensis]|uniref:GNAT family N-acetyltransferase n=1 Tax=Guptibacillus hwajinpoensis TaxID=208199 RepID=UPI001883FD77|nr:GNAT family N-acetyltransferase [Pseudalkalibacillus hwajinpoensis]MBF0705859.1 GNAT family N-acetyltransferase [Pseudalkalibacillus hwajinpoensis]